MIPDWLYPNPYEEATKRLNDTITIAKLRDAINELAESMRKAAHPRHPHAGQEANPNYPPDSSNG